MSIIVVLLNGKHRARIIKNVQAKVLVLEHVH